MIARAGDEGQGGQGGAQKWRSMPAAADIGRRLQICKGFRGLRAREVKAPGGEAHPCGRVRKKGRTATPTAHESASRSLLQPSPCRNRSAVRAEILQNSLGPLPRGAALAHLYFSCQNRDFGSRIGPKTGGQHLC